MQNAGFELRKQRSEFTQIARRYEPSLMRCALRLYRGNTARAEDIVQETLIRAYQAYAAAGMREGKSALPLLQRILTNLFINDYNHRRRWEAGSDLEDLDLSAIDPAGQAHMASTEVPGARLMSQTLDEDLERALAALPADLRQTIWLVDVQGHSYDEAADALGVPIGTVRSRLARGRMKLHDLLQEFGKRMGYIQQEGTAKAKS